MRIVSPFKDFYDSMSAWDDGYNLLYRRVTSQPLIVDHPAWVPRHNDKMGYLIGFAGEVYPLLKHYRDKKPTQIIYDSELIVETLRWTCGNQQPFGNKEHWKGFFDAYGPCWIAYNNIVEYYRDEKTKYYCSKNPNRLIQNPRLIDYGFQKVLSPEVAYNELNKFLCNQQRPMMPIPEMSNDIKIEQHGFDLKTSFRKGKSK